MCNNDFVIIGNNNEVIICNHDDFVIIGNNNVVIICNNDATTVQLQKLK